MFANESRRVTHATFVGFGLTREVQREAQVKGNRAKAVPKRE